MRTLIGPFDQIITMDKIPQYGPLRDRELEIITDGGIIIEDQLIINSGNFLKLTKDHIDRVDEVDGHYTLIPGLIDAHTHICYTGSRAGDYVSRISGHSYQEILNKGGGIYETVKKTQEATHEELYQNTKKRVDRHFGEGVTTMEIKSGYGLSVDSEIKMLEVITQLNQNLKPDLVTTCLAAHILPPTFKASNAYLEHILNQILPSVKHKKLSNRVDIFIEENAFLPEESLHFLLKAKNIGFKITVHADQFTPGGSEIAARVRAVSADHLEATQIELINMLVENDVVATVLPGASLGLGVPFAPARKILDAGACLVIATDWNPGSAPMGDLILQASLLSASQKLTFAETIAGITYRAAKALSLTDRGKIVKGLLADFIAFRTNDYREILYYQGKLKPDIIWKNGKKNLKSNIS